MMLTITLSAYRLHELVSFKAFRAMLQHIRHIKIYCQTLETFSGLQLQGLYYFFIIIIMCLAYYIIFLHSCVSKLLHCLIYVIN